MLRGACVSGEPDNQTVHYIGVSASPANRERQHHDPDHPSSHLWQSPGRSFEVIAICEDRETAEWLEQKLIAAHSAEPGNVLENFEHAVR